MVGTIEAEGDQISAYRARGLRKLLCEKTDDFHFNPLGASHALSLIENEDRHCVQLMDKDICQSVASLDDIFASYIEMCNGPHFLFTKRADPDSLFAQAFRDLSGTEGCL